MSESLEQAQQKITELLEAARKGMIIPVRLPGQIEEIGALLEAARKEIDEAAAAAASVAPPDMEKYLADEAYFIGHAVHELRTPMTSIRGYSDMLGSMGSLNDMQKQFLGIIQVNTRRMEGLLTDVSLTNKIRKGTLKITTKMDMFKNIALRVEKDMRPLAEDLKRGLEFDVPDGLPLLNTDGELLTVALNKLVDNALKYSPAETGLVRVSGQADGSTLVIRIEDNGCGMLPEEIEQLGTIYFRSDNDIVREHKGSGLGIPIAYGIIKLLGGSIALESEPEKGTTFTVRLAGMT